MRIHWEKIYLEDISIKSQSQSHKKLLITGKNKKFVFALKREGKRRGGGEEKREEKGRMEKGIGREKARRN